MKGGIHVKLLKKIICSVFDHKWENELRNSSLRKCLVCRREEMLMRDRFTGKMSWRERAFAPLP